MIAEVMRLSTVFANMMLGAAFALAITIGVGGTIEHTRAGCYGCLHTSSSKTMLAEAPSPMQLAFGAPKTAARIE